MTEKDQWVEDFIRGYFHCGNESSYKRLTPTLRKALERVYPYIIDKWRSEKFYVVCVDRVMCASPGAGWDILVSINTLEWTDKQIEGSIGHEIAHWFLDGINDLEADRLCREWGFER